MAMMDCENDDSDALQSQSRRHTKSLDHYNYSHIVENFHTFTPLPLSEWVYWEVYTVVRP